LFLFFVLLLALMHRWSVVHFASCMWMQSVMGVSAQQLLTYCTEDVEDGWKEWTLKKTVMVIEFSKQQFSKSETWFSLANAFVIY